MGLISWLQNDKRHFRNLLLQPLLQIKLGIYSIILAAVFSAAVSALLYSSFSDFYEIMLVLSDSEDDVLALFEGYLATTRWSVGSLIIAYFLTNLIVSIVFTHRLVGPTIAFRNHLQKLRQGDYKARVVLRKGDAFVEVADELNKLTEQLAEDKPDK